LKKKTPAAAKRGQASKAGPANRGGPANKNNPAAKPAPAAKKLPGWLPDVANAPSPPRGKSAARGKPKLPGFLPELPGDRPQLVARAPQATSRGQVPRSGRLPFPEPRPGQSPTRQAKAAAPQSAEPKAFKSRGPKPFDGKQGAPQSRDEGRRDKSRSGHTDPHADREAQRYEHPIPSREAILKYLSDNAELLTTEVLARGLGLRDERDIEALTKRLGAMVRDGQLLQNRRGGYGAASKLDLIPGSIIANAEGFGFLRPDAGGDDIYISPAEMRKVMHGDRALLSIVGVDRRGRKQGAIVEVLERRAARLVGRVVVDKGVMLVSPDDRRLHQDILILPGKEKDARTGQIVVIEITQPPTAQHGPMGEVISVLGERLTPSIIVEMAIAGHGLPQEFPPDALREAAQVEPQVTAKEIAVGRVDLRKVPLVTIDGEDARDFDDAVYTEPVPGGFRLLVAIADVSHYVRPGSALDEEAVKRSTSVYFPGFVVPMLPETLSNGICSLMPKVERLCMVCDMHVSHTGDVSKTRFYPAVMRSHARLTYNKVWAALGLKDPEALSEVADVLPHLEHLHQLYQILLKARKRRGAIDFESREVKFRLDAGGDVVQMAAEERNDAHKLIEECMIAANVEAARFLDAHKIPALYRVHATPPESKYEDLQEFLLEFGLRMPPYAEVKPADFSNLIKKIKDRPDAGLIQSVLLRSQSLAVYSAQDAGHFGLALDAYAHFTSPIRRYPDLLVHRAIRYALTNGKPSDYTYSPNEMAGLATHCSKNERRADEASRDVDERYKISWMEKHVGSEFDGIVSGVTSFGMFVELKESSVSGLVHITQLPNDYYHFDPVRHLISGERRGLQFRLGDAVRVQVLRASMEDRKIDFRLVQEPQVQGQSPKAAPAPSFLVEAEVVRSQGPKSGRRKKSK
jgi:ribonuclease R